MSKSYICSECEAEIPVSDSYYKVLRDRNPEQVCKLCRTSGRIDTHRKKWQITEQGRICKICNIWKEWVEFPGKRERQDGRVVQCSQCRRKDFKTKFGTDIEFTKQARLSTRRAHLKKAYGITPEDFDMMVSQRDGKCDICLKIPKTKLCVDHCHTTLKIRGLLCRGCNIAIGLLLDCPESMNRAMEYINANKN